MFKNADEYLAVAPLFQLGDLDTEKPNAKTTQLSDWVRTDLKKAIDALVEVDTDALKTLSSKVSELLPLRKDILDTWAKGHRVFLIGCGATGRLSLTLEYMYRKIKQIPRTQNDAAVVALMAGGDVALVHSLEGFEDHPELAVRHLAQLGFKAGDLLVAITEGGETPFVIGGVEFAARTSVSPYFLYCNPDIVLREKVQRSRQVIENNKIKKINLAVGSMALTGSTRMQASTVLQLAVGLALLTDLSEQDMKLFLQKMISLHQEVASLFLSGFIEREAREYQEERFVIYRPNDNAISIFTDTTERAPTFSLTPFSHKKAPRLLKLKPSLSYVFIPQAKTSEEAWQILLERAPRPLNWPDVDDRSGTDYLSAFDFSPMASGFRNQITLNAEHNFFDINKTDSGFEWNFMDLVRQIEIDKDNLKFSSSSSDSSIAGVYILFENIILKMLINIHSTLVMGLMARYEQNLMTYVYPTNGKLIDRAARYVQILLRKHNVIKDYETIVRQIFKEHQNLKSGDSVVLNTVKALS